MKRFFDLTTSILFILITFPAWLLLSVLIKIDSPGPVFYKGVRVGKGGEKFKIFKFRTMVDKADIKGPAITGRDDDRVTCIGSILRKMKLDELPQLINVIKGDMSIIGPRPEGPKYVKHYTQRQKIVLSVRPGMASPAFIKYRHEEELLRDVNEKELDDIYLNKILPEKLELDIDYIKTQSFIGDLRILINAGLSLFTSYDNKPTNN